MSIKLLVIFVCAAVGTAAGYLVMRGFRRDLLYLDGVCSMIAELKRNIAYKREPAVDILAGFTSESPQLKKHIDEYIAAARTKDGDLALSRGTLSAATLLKVRELFISLGKVDGQAQVGELEMYAASFSDLRDKAKTKSDKFGPLAVKLGFLFGLMVGILFL